MIVSICDDTPETIACQGVLDAINAQIAVLDRQGVIVAANRAWLRSVAAKSGDHMFRVGANYRDAWNDDRSIFARSGAGSAGGHRGGAAWRARLFHV
jgi:PAS domain-containing protein